MTREGEVEREGKQTDRIGRGKWRRAWAKRRQKDLVTSSE